MAKHFTEDALDVIHDGFLLVLLAAERAKEINIGSKPLVSEQPKNTKYPDKKPIIALHEIADHKLDKEQLVKKLQETLMQHQGVQLAVDPQKLPPKVQLMKEVIEDDVKVKIYDNEIPIK